LDRSWNTRGKCIYTLFNNENILVAVKFFLKTKILATDIVHVSNFSRDFVDGV
jgi:hypothetical protein